MAFRCTKCGSAISAAQIDFAQKIGKCSACGEISPLAPTFSEGASLGVQALVPPSGLTWRARVHAQRVHIRVKSTTSVWWMSAVMSILCVLVGAGLMIASTFPEVHESRPGSSVDFIPPPLWVGLPFLLGGLYLWGVTFRRLFGASEIIFSTHHVALAPHPGTTAIERHAELLTFEPERGTVTIIVNDATQYEWNIRVQTTTGPFLLPVQLDSEQHAAFACAEMNVLLQKLKSTNDAYRAPDRS